MKQFCPSTVFRGCRRGLDDHVRGHVPHDVLRHAAHALRLHLVGQVQTRSLIVITSAVNFTSILKAVFLYKSILPSISLLSVWLCKFLTKEYWRKSCPKYVG